MPDSREIYLARSISDFRICGIASCRVSLTLVHSRMGRLLLIIRLVSVCGDDAQHLSFQLSRSIFCGVRVERKFFVACVSSVLRAPVADMCPCNVT
jgi:hypothetical protein